MTIQGQNSICTCISKKVGVMGKERKKKSQQQSSPHITMQTWHLMHFQQTVNVGWINFSFHLSTFKQLTMSKAGVQIPRNILRSCKVYALVVAEAAAGLCVDAATTGAPGIPAAVPPALFSSLTIDPKKEPVMREETLILLLSSFQVTNLAQCISRTAAQQSLTRTPHTEGSEQSKIRFRCPKWSARNNSFQTIHSPWILRNPLQTSVAIRCTIILHCT